nr:alanine racemase [Bordetella sp. BOR01]
MTADHRIQASIDATAIAHNLALIRQRARQCARPPRIWATVKADAYGHGLALVLPGLVDADGIAVQYLSDAHACRQAGWQGPILVYAGLQSASEAALLNIPGLHLVISHAAQIDWLSARPPRPEAPDVWLRFCGDLRLAGFDIAAYGRADARCRELAAQHRIGQIGHLNHYAHAEDEDGIAAAHALFRQATRDLPGPISTCNSAAMWRHAGHMAETDWIRPGLALYGASPLPGTHGPALGLRPAMTLTARLMSLQTVAAGESAGYRSSFVATQATRIGLVGCGYADGYPRHAASGTPVLVNGHRSQVLGCITMDVTMIDLTGIADAVPGAPVTLWGAPGLPVETVAAAAGTIAAELLCGLTARVPLVAHAAHPA